MRAVLYCDIVLMHEGMAAKVGGLGERITDHFITSPASPDGQNWTQPSWIVTLIKSYNLYPHALTNIW